MENTRGCGKCKKRLPLSQFYVRRYKGGGAGFQHWCKDCTNIRAIEWRKDNPKKAREASAKWKRSNPEKVAVGQNRRQKEYRSNNLNFRIAGGIRNAMNMALKKGFKAGHTIELLGCSIEYLYHHLENQFTEGMTWDNYGRNGWHIDHIIPLSYFDLSDPEQQKRAWYYTNLRPMWASDNITKGNKIIEIQLVLM